MKVICTDNYGREWIADHLVVDGLTQEQATAVARAMNDVASHTDYFKVVSDDYKLRVFSP